MERTHNLPSQAELNQLLRVAMSRHLYLGEALYVISAYRTQRDKSTSCFPVLAENQSLLHIRTGAGGQMWAPPQYVKIKDLKERQLYALTDRQDSSLFYVRNCKAIDSYLKGGENAITP